MIYRAIGLMSGSSLDGLDIAFTVFHENGGKWSYEITAADCLPYSPEWIQKLRDATQLSALDYQLLHTEYGRYMGQMVNAFIDKHQLHFKVAVMGSHGHTSFHLPEQRMTAQLGDGAALAAETGLPVVSDLRAMDVALGGQGAPIVPIGERLLMSDYRYFLNIGGIANLSINHPEAYMAFDICAANRVLNLLANEAGQEYDAGGEMARGGQVLAPLLEALEQLTYYQQVAPKSLANSFGTDVVFPLIKNHTSHTQDALRTYTEHIALRIKAGLQTDADYGKEPQQLLVTGGGAFNTFLIERLADIIVPELVVPDDLLVQYKEAMIMGLIGVLRWREENNVLASVTGASRASVGGAFWMGAST